MPESAPSLRRITDAVQPVAPPGPLPDIRFVAADGTGRTLADFGIPATLVVDRQGRERARLEGGLDWAAEDAAATIRKLIR